MSSKAPHGKKRIGRPPAGERAGEKVKDYPQLSIRLPAEVKATLHALSLVNARPQWRLISDAIACYLKTRPESEQRMVSALIGRSRARRASARPAPRTRTS
jgi:predicted DNA-binding protein